MRRRFGRGGRSRTRGHSRRRHRYGRAARGTRRGHAELHGAELRHTSGDGVRRDVPGQGRRDGARRGDRPGPRHRRTASRAAHRLPALLRENGRILRRTGRLPARKRPLEGDRGIPTPRPAARRESGAGIGRAHGRLRPGDRRRARRFVLLGCVARDHRRDPRTEGRGPRRHAPRHRRRLRNPRPDRRME